MKADSFHGFIFFEIMITVKTNKIQCFIFISLTFHALLFVAWAGFIPLKKDFQYVDVFLLRDYNPTNELPSNIKRDDRKIKKIPKIESPEKKKLESISPEKIETVSEKAENLNFKKTEMGKNYDIQTGINSSSSSEDKLASQGRGDKIIDTSFESANGPKFLYREIPVYPPMARRLGKEGKVVLKLTINEKGELINIEIIESAPYGFTESAVEAVKKSKFLPATKNGYPVASRAILPIKFVLKN